MEEQITANSECPELAFDWSFANPLTVFPQYPIRLLNLARGQSLLNMGGHATWHNLRATKPPKQDKIGTIEEYPLRDLPRTRATSVTLLCKSRAISAAQLVRPQYFNPRSRKLPAPSPADLQPFAVREEQSAFRGRSCSRALCPASANLQKRSCNRTITIVE